MLRLISSKLAQTSGDLSIPSSDQQVLQPYVNMIQWGKKEWEKFKQEKAKQRASQNLAHYELSRNPQNGTCASCGKYNAIDERGNKFCPTPGCNIRRY